MLWLIYALLGALLMTTYSLSIRILLKDKGDSKAFTLITTFFGALVLLFLIPFENMQFFFNFKIIFLLIILGLLFGITDLLFIRGRQLEEVSNVSLLVQFGNIWALFGGAILLNEPITLAKLLGVGLILIGNVLVVWQGKQIKLSKGGYFIIIATLLFTIGSFIDKKLVVYFSSSLYKSILFIVEAIILYIFFVPERNHAIKKEFQLQGLNICFVGPLLALAMFFLMKSFQVGGEASRVLPIFGLSLVFSVIAGALLLNEKNNLVKKILALILVLAGTYLLI